MSRKPSKKLRNPSESEVDYLLDLQHKKFQAELDLKQADINLNIALKKVQRDCAVSPTACLSDDFKWVSREGTLLISELESTE